MESLLNYLAFENKSKISSFLVMQKYFLKNLILGPIFYGLCLIGYKSVNRR